MTVALGWYTLIDWQIQGRFDPVGVWSTVLLGLVLVGRQGILTGEIEFQRYASLVDSIAEPTFICTPGGMIELANPAFIQAFGAGNQLRGSPLKGLISSEVSMEELLLAGLEKGWSGEAELLCPDGRRLPVKLSLRPLVWGGRGKRALAGTAHDLSEIKRQQADLRLAYQKVATAQIELEKLNMVLEERVIEKTADLTDAYLQLERQNLTLQNLDRLKSDFVSLVSHELRAPLTNISGGIELLLSRSFTLSPNTIETLEIVQTEILRLARFTETILDLSMLDAGRQPIFPGPLDFQNVVNTIQRQVTHIPGGNRIHWDLPDFIPLIIADETALTSVIFHLLDNALKYAPLGEIRLEMGKGLPLGAETSGEMAWIRISDQGKGISQADLPMLFTRFFRSQSSDNQTVYGHGLGLYIVKHLLEAMNGKIEVTNRPEGGACFTCWLPLLDDEDGWEVNELQDSAG